MSFFYNAGTGVGEYGSTLTDDQLQGAYKRDSHLDYQAAQVKKIAAAYQNPGAYYAKKATALELLATQAAVIYKDEYKKLIKLKVPSSLAQVRATKMANAYEELLRADLEQDYPGDLNNLSLNLAYGQGMAAKSGFSKPDTEAPAASAPRKSKSRK